jgi:hypothetical protein
MGENLMLYKEDKFNDGTRFTEWRYFCECGMPHHVLAFDEYEDENGQIELTITVVAEDWSFWKRLKEAVRIIFGKDVVYSGICICKEDREELGAAIRGDIAT